jgi:hypothetical protein
MVGPGLLMPRLQLPGVPFMTAAAIGPHIRSICMPSLLRSADVNRVESTPWK